MANAINYWYQQIINQKNVYSGEGQPLQYLDSESSVSNFNLWAYIVAFVMCVLDNLFDQHVAEIQTALATQKPHGLQWYQSQALAFQWGQDLVPGTNTYANTGLTPAQITAQMIINQAAVTEVSNATNVGLRIKVVSLSGDTYTQLTSGQLTAFTSYMSQIKDAGVNIIAQSPIADGLKNAIQIFYDPLILKSDGTRIDGNPNSILIPATGYTKYLQSLPYNGQYSNTALSNFLQTVSGVILVNITLAQAQYGEFPYTNIDELYVPDGGYLSPAPGYPIFTFTPYPTAN